MLIPHEKVADLTWVFSLSSVMPFDWNKTVIVLASYQKVFKFDFSYLVYCFYGWVVDKLINFLGAATI